MVKNKGKSVWYRLVFSTISFDDIIFLSLDPPGANGIRFQLPKKGLKPAQPFSGQKRFHSPYGHKGKNNDLQNQDGHQQGFISDNKNQMSANQR